MDEYLNNFNHEFQLQTLLAEAKVILHKEGDLNSEKENLSKIIERVDFLLGKHDELYEKFTELFTSMGEFNFTKKLEINENGDQIVNFIISGLNMLNDEFNVYAINKKILHDFFRTCPLKNIAAIITKPDGLIYFANPGNTNLSSFNDSVLLDQSVHALFTDFSVIENRIKDEGSIKNIDAEMKWKGERVPAKVDVTICNSFGKIESLIYLIKLEII